MNTNRVNFLPSQLKRRKRGVNLANRHTRLLVQDDESAINTPSLPSASNAKYPTIKPPPPKIYFEGILIPQRPIPPSPEDCCMSNCRPCVHDIYLSTLTQYKRYITYIRNTLEQGRIPIYTWPNEIRPQEISPISEDPETFRPLADLQMSISSDKKPRFDLTEMKAIKAAQEARAIMVKQAKASGTSTAGGTSTLLEAGRLVLWVLKGCPE